MKKPSDIHEKLSVVIVNWERPYDTLACVQSIRDSLQTTKSILVVDNGSMDGSIDILRSSYPNLHIISLPKNLGFAAGYNVGIQAALESKATHLLLLNNDTIVEPSTIPELISCSTDISVPKILYLPRKERIWAAGAYWRKFSGTVKMRGNGKFDRGQYEESINLEYATACALMIHREVIETIGFFDEHLINYFEDYDFCYRARQAGFSIQYEPRAVVYHRDATSLDRTPGLRWWFIARNTVIFLDKHYKSSPLLLQRNIFWVCLRELLLLRFRRLYHYLKGYRDGVRELRKTQIS